MLGSARSLLRPLLLVALVSSPGCERSPAGATQEPTETAEADVGGTALRGWHYEVTPSPELDHADVRVCFDGRPPALLVPGTPEVRAHAQARTLQGEALPQTAQGFSLQSLADDACVDYTVDLDGMQGGGGMGRMVGETGRSVMARPSAWLWRPDTMPADAEVTLRFAMPDGLEASVPWPTHGDAPRGGPNTEYRLDTTAFRWLAYAVMGRITVDRFERAGAQVELVTLDAEVACPPDGLRRWITDAVDTVALLFDGRFPRDRLQVVVIPVEGGGGGTVYFGLAGRGGGAGIFVFLDDRAKAEQLPGGWTTVHEMLHHGMPFIDEPWMGEGWVSYYTELMRTRKGHRSELEGWQALHDAFERGRQRSMDISLEQTSEQMHETHAYQRVYWGGASVAFLADVQMRLETNGERGLDDAMQELRRCCGDATHLWRAQALLARLDTWYGRPLFTETAQQVLRGHDLPDVEAAMARLGVVVEGDTVRLDDQHPAAAIRRSIMAPPR